MKTSFKSLLLIGSAGVVSALMIAPAEATTGVPYQNDWYLGLSGDLTWLRHSNTGGGGNVDLGYRFNNVRVEGEAGYHSAGGSGGYSGTHYFTYMGNLYYDFNPMSSIAGIKPYIGVGAGDAETHYGNSSFTTTFHHHDNTFAYQGMAGINFTMASMPNTDWNVGYRYLGTDEHNLHANNLELGARFYF